MKLLLIWLLILLASASVSHLLARTARKLTADRKYTG